MRSIDKYIGIPYKSRGRGESLDCWGLVRCIYKDEFNITLPNLDGYDDSENGEQVQNVVETESFKNWTKIVSPLPFSVVVFRMGRHCSHVGVMLDAVHFLHALKNRNSCVERIDKAQWEKRVDGFYRWTPC